jgi:hypothetical protein
VPDLDFGDAAELLLALAVILASARALGALAVRTGLPARVGELSCCS